MSTVITPFQGIDSFSMATFNNRISQINTGFSYISNQNLLDNWYFGNPVDQRGGYVVPPGTNVYNDSGLTSLVGASSVYYKVVEFGSTYAKVLNESGGYFYSARSAAVRGYTGAGYGIDRWFMDYGTLKIQNDIIELSGASVGGALEQRVENPKRFAGKMVTLSVLGNRSKASWYVTVRQDGVYRNINLNITNSFACASVTFVADSTLSNDLAIVFACWDESDVAEIKAAKLELGTTQTLAHQDENGNWVLNEIPNYGEQLARCQRYQFIPERTARSTQFKYEESTKRLYGQITFPVTMRTTPGLSLENAVMRDNTDGSYLTLSSANVEFMTRDGLWLIYNPVVKSGTFVDGHIYSFDSRIIFDANL